MTLREYQEKAMATCMPSCKNFPYMMLNLVGEVGEFASKVAKAIRKNEIFLDSERIFDVNDDREDFDPNEWRDFNKSLEAELGDILWQLSGLCSYMEWSLEDIAQANLAKLASRKERGVIDGNGDNR